MGRPSHYWRADVPEGPVHPAALDSTLLLDPIEAWLDADDDRPFLLYVHTLDPHSPHAPPQRLLERVGRPEADATLGSLERLRALGRQEGTPPPDVVRDLVALYEAEVAFTDASFGALRDTLRERGLERRAVVVLVSDHGEAFWEHGRRGHGAALGPEVLRIPLLVRPPGGTEGPRRVPDLVQHVDLLPTLLDYAGVPAPEGLPGRSLRVLVEGGERPADAAPAPLALSFGMDGWSVTDGRLQLVRRRGAPPVLYDIAAEPGARPDLARRRPGWRRVLDRRAAEALARHGRPVFDAEVAASPDALRERLSALGYVDGAE